MVMDDTDRKVWVVGAAGHGSAAYEGRFSQAVATTLRRMAKGALDVHPSLKHVPVRVFAAGVQRELDRLCVVDGATLPQKLEMTPQFHPVDHAPAFFENPRYRSEYVDTVLAVREGALGTFLRDLDPAFDPIHYLSRASGDPDRRSITGQCYFTGRDEQLAELSAWIDGVEEHKGNFRVVTGSPGVGKSALIGMLVCAAHPKLKPLATGVMSRVSPDRLPSVNDRFIAVHARGLSLNEVIDSLARQLTMKQPAGKRWNPRDFCYEVINSQEGTPVVVLDALDEATEPEAILNQLLLPLVQMRGRYGADGCRLLVGVRPWQQFEPLLAEARDIGGLVDLDQLQPEQVRVELAEYTRALFAGASLFGGPDRRTFRTEAADTIAEALTKADMGGGFLVAGLYVHFLTTLPVEQVTTSTVAEQVPRSLGDVLELHLHGLTDGQDWLRPVLAALGRAKGEGMSRRLLTCAARAFVPDTDYSGTSLTGPPETVVEEVLSLVSFYLRTSAGPDGMTVYRFFHQALADHMKAHPHSPREQPVKAAALDERAYVALLDAERPSPHHRPDWRNADPYLLRHLVEHAVEAGRADELLMDSEFLAHADARHLVPLLENADGEPARLMASAYRTSGPHHLTASPYERRQLISVDVARWGDVQTSSAVMCHPDAPPPAWTCVAATCSGIRTNYLGALRGHEEPVRKMLMSKTSEQLVVSLGEDRSVRVWDITTFEQQACVAADADDIATAVIAGEEVVVTLALDGGLIRMWDLASLQPRSGPLTDPDRPVIEMHTYPATHGPFLVSRSSIGVLRMWNLEEGRILGKKGVRKPEPVKVTTVALDGRQLGVRLTGKKGGGEYLVWDVEKDKFIGAEHLWRAELSPYTLAAELRYVTPERDLPENYTLNDLHTWTREWRARQRRLEVARRRMDEECRQRKAREDDLQQLIAALSPTSSSVSVTVQVAGQTIALVAQPDGPVHVWRLMPETEARPDEAGHRRPVQEVTHVQGRVVSRAADDSILHEGQIARLSSLSAVAAAVVPDIGPVILAAGVQGRLHVVEGWRRGETRTRRVARYRNRITRILPAGDACFVTAAARRLRYWKLLTDSDGQYGAETRWALRLPSPVTAMAHLPSGVLVATADGETALLASEDGGRLWAEGAEQAIVDLTAVGPEVVALTEQGMVEFWHPLTPETPPGRFRRELYAADSAAMCVAAHLAAGRPLVAIGHTDRTLRVADVHTAQQVGPPLWLPDVPRAVTWLGERRLAVGSGADVLEIAWQLGGT
ncbi:NACHT and WD repeat domain-containing protein [Streptomyces sp. NPDC001046]|uniref:NACHT and WD repeat domain-containing protein n=1 Tax=Streptomyces sp. NPDC001046 TaxID=3364543 RepID=UPI0036B70793